MNSTSLSYVLSYVSLECIWYICVVDILCLLSEQSIVDMEIVYILNDSIVLQGILWSISKSGPFIICQNSASCSGLKNIPFWPPAAGLLWTATNYYYKQTVKGHAEICINISSSNVHRIYIILRDGFSASLPTWRFSVLSWFFAKVIWLKLGCAHCPCSFHDWTHFQ